MKVIVTEIREARFREPTASYAMCDIKTIYQVRVIDLIEGEIKTFFNKDDVETYIRFLKEKKNDYSKVIKEIEI